MRRLGLGFAIIVLLAGASVQAQKKPRLKPEPIGPPVSRMLSVQDETGDGYILFDMVSGDFKCNMCEYNFTFGGTGEVKVDGFNVYLTAVSDTYRVFVSLNIWDGQGKAVMEMFPDSKGDVEPYVEHWTDLNIKDNSLDCPNIK